MIRLGSKHHPALSFSPDEPVLAMSCDPEARRLVIALTACFVGEDLMLEGVRLEVSGWHDLVYEAHVEEEGLQRLNPPLHEFSDLCEFELGDKRVFMAGFARQARGYFNLTLVGAGLTVEYAGERRIVPSLPPRPYTLPHARVPPPRHLPDPRSRPRFPVGGGRDRARRAGRSDPRLF